MCNKSRQRRPPRGGRHFNNVGSYIVGTTFYARLYRDDPRGMTADPNNENIEPKKDLMIDEKLATAIQHSVWTVVSKHSLAGVRMASSREGETAPHYPYPISPVRGSGDGKHRRSRARSFNPHDVSPYLCGIYECLSNSSCEHRRPSGRISQLGTLMGWLRAVLQIPASVQFATATLPWSTDPPQTSAEAWVSGSASYRNS